LDFSTAVVLLLLLVVLLSVRKKIKTRKREQMVDSGIHGIHKKMKINSFGACKNKVWL